MWHPPPNQDAMDPIDWRMSRLNPYLKVVNVNNLFTAVQIIDLHVSTHFYDRELGIRINYCINSNSCRVQIVAVSLFIIL